jgi:hypothetical protein
VVGDKLFVSLVDEYSVVALDVISGRKIWEFTTGSRVDTPPTYYNGKVLFGSADGWVYCVRASDGEMVWRFRAALDFRYIMDFGRLESAWPVHGSILILNDVAYFAAGRSSHLDGGIYLYGIDPETGELLHFNHLEGPYRDFKDFQDNVDPPQGALVDILQSDGEHIYMRHLTFDSKLLEQQKEGGAMLRAKGGFLDDTYFKRAPWYFESSQNWGRIIVNNGPTFYAVKMFESLQGLNPNIYFIPERKGYLLYAKTLGSDIPSAWSEYIPIRVKAMVLTDERLYIAGPPDVVDPEDPLAAFEGKKGGLLRIVYPGTGKNLGEYELDSPPVFNGMVVTENNLYLSTRNGRVLCFGSKR